MGILAKKFAVFENLIFGSCTARGGGGNPHTKPQKKLRNNLNHGFAISPGGLWRRMIPIGVNKNVAFGNPAKIFSAVLRIFFNFFSHVQIFISPLAHVEGGFFFGTPLHLYFRGILQCVAAIHSLAPSFKIIGQMIDCSLMGGLQPNFL